MTSARLPDRLAQFFRHPERLLAGIDVTVGLDLGDQGRVVHRPANKQETTVRFIDRHRGAATVLAAVFAVEPYRHAGLLCYARARTCTPTVTPAEQAVKAGDRALLLKPPGR